MNQFPAAQVRRLVELVDFGIRLLGPANEPDQQPGDRFLIEAYRPRSRSALDAVAGRAQPQARRFSLYGGSPSAYRRRQ